LGDALRIGGRRLLGGGEEDKQPNRRMTWVLGG
jgi:hypothetical protein